MKVDKRNKNKIQKIIIAFVILFCGLFVFCNQIYASITDPITDPGYYKPGYNLNSNNTKFIERANLILGVIRVFGTLISVVTLMTLGIRYMLAGAQDKALYKETLGPYVIGAIMVFAIPNIIGVIFDLLGSVNAGI